MAKTAKPRLIYNDDTCSLRYIPKPHTVDKVHTAVDYLAGTQVDVFCWCMCTQQAYAYRSKKVENYFDADSADPCCGFKADEDLMLSLYEQGHRLPANPDRSHARKTACGSSPVFVRMTATIAPSPTGC